MQSFPQTQARSPSENPMDSVCPICEGSGRSKGHGRDRAHVEADLKKHQDAAARLQDELAAMPSEQPAAPEPPADDPAPAPAAETQPEASESEPPPTAAEQPSQASQTEG